MIVGARPAGQCHPITLAPLSDRRCNAPGFGQCAAATMTEHERRKALGFWGERKALTLLRGANFAYVRDLNEATFNHPFGDISAERNGIRYLVGVKTRNKYTARGTLNPTYNIRKKGANVAAIAEQHNADLAWVAIQVVPERGVFWAYFGTIAQIEDRGERFSIPMRAFSTPKYECLADQEADATISAEWSNGGFGLSRDRPIDF